MGNIIDWLREYGSHTFSELPFRDVDNLILSYLAYYHLGGIVPAPKTHSSITMSEAGKKYLAMHGDTQTDVNADVFRQLIISARYSTALLSDYTEVFHRGVTQFAAVRITLPGDMIYLAFRGSDNSLTSWQESFAISYEITPAQKMAASWFERIMAEPASVSAFPPHSQDQTPTQPETGGDLTIFPGGHSKEEDMTIFPGGHSKEDDMTFFLGGHSKGGNMALYAAAACSRTLRSRISRIYLNDSPWLTPGLTDAAILASLRPITVRITPQYSLIGQLFASGKPDTIVVCSTEGVNQHEPLFWQTEGTHLKTAGDLTPESLRIGRTLNRWIASASYQERRRFTKDLFRTLRRWRAEGGTAVPQAQADNKTPGVSAPAGENTSAGKSASVGKSASAHNKSMQIPQLLLRFALNASLPSHSAALKLAFAFLQEILGRR